METPPITVNRFLNYVYLVVLVLMRLKYATVFHYHKTLNTLLLGQIWSAREVVGVYK